MLGNITADSEVIGNLAGGGHRYFLKDHLGSVRTTVDRNGNVVGHDDYCPFGLAMPWRSSNSSNPNDDYKFTGYELDDEARLTVYHAGARGYDPVLGRFMQIDPMSHLYPGISTYAYVANNPLVFVDPTGETIEVCNGSGDERNCVTYEAGMEYDGDDEFIGNVISVLNEINSIDIGSEVIGALVSSDNMFSFVDKKSSKLESEGLVGFAFRPKSGEIFAGFITETSQASAIGSIAHESFHAYQSLFGNPRSINSEVGGYLYGNAVAYTLNYPVVSGLAVDTKEARAYEPAFNNLLFNESFSIEDYQAAINNFKLGSPANYSGIYNSFPIKPINPNPPISNLYPLMRW